MADQLVENLKENLRQHLNVPAFLKEMLDEGVKQALQKAVDDTSNPFDNIAMNAVYPVVVAELNKFVSEQWAGLLSPPVVHPVG